MAKLKIDLRKVLRLIAQRAQDENALRLAGGSGVDGEAIADRKAPGAPVKSRRKVKIVSSAVRVPLSELSKRAGVKTGEMLKDATRRGNIRMGRTSFKIVPSPDERKKWFAFTAGTKRQTARPVSGMSDELLAAAAAEVARETREQLCRAANQALREGRR